MSVNSEDCIQMVNRKAEVRRATSQATPSSTTFNHLSHESRLSRFGSIGCSRANAAWLTTMRGAVWVRPQPTGVIHQSPREDLSIITSQAKGLRARCCSSKGVHAHALGCVLVVFRLVSAVWVTVPTWSRIVHRTHKVALDLTNVQAGHMARAVVT